MNSLNRQAALEQIRQNPAIPVLILGGGVNGAGLFRELALQGVDCLLVDKADFVSGASSKSSRMIHGGLRYLENREFRLVRESLLERNRLLDNAPHYVTPLKTTIPLFSRFGGLLRSALIFLGFDVRPGERGALLVKLGLTFYDFVTRAHRRTPRHFFTSRAATLRDVPGLTPRLVCAANYWDAQVSEAERLCIELLRDARAANPRCHALNYVRPERAEGGAVVLRDELGGATLAVRPHAVVNATGAWVDLANAALGAPTHFMGGTKGSHLVVDNRPLYDALGDRMVYYEHTDGRVCIVFRFLDKVLMGSTDLRIDDPDAARCEESEIAYMLTTLRGVFPGIEVRRDQIAYVFCGVRPLPASGKGVTAIISRGHSLRVVEPTADRPFPIYCLVGGKWTTFRAFAEQVADRLLARLGRPRLCATDRTPIGGGRNCPATDAEREAWVRRVAAARSVCPARVALLLARYGTDAEAYLAGADARAETPLETLPDYSVGEIERIARDEAVVHLSDLVVRRSTLALRGRATPNALHELAEILAPVLGWDAARQAREVRLARDEVAVPKSE